MLSGGELRIFMRFRTLGLAGRQPHPAGGRIPRPAAGPASADRSLTRGPGKALAAGHAEA